MPSRFHLSSSSTRRFIHKYIHHMNTQPHGKNGRKMEMGNNIQKIFNDLSLSQNPAFSAQLFLSDNFETKMLYNADVIVVHDVTEQVARKERTARKAKEEPIPLLKSNQKVN